jgi:hypothetical protein
MTPEAQLRSFIAKFTVADQRRIRAVRSAMRRRFPWAHEMVYDNYNCFVIGYSPTERPSDAIVSIAARAQLGHLLHSWRGAARSERPAAGVGPTDPVHPRHQRERTRISGRERAVQGRRGAKPGRKTARPRQAHHSIRQRQTAASPLVAIEYPL